MFEIIVGVVVCSSLMMSGRYGGNIPRTTDYGLQSTEYLMLIRRNPAVIKRIINYPLGL